MENSNPVCPVCTLFLREGITLETHLETHPKEQVIQALLKATNGGTKQTQSTISASVPEPAENVQQAQNYSSSNPTFASNAPSAVQNYINPATQMTAAVTYQQFVTSNGSAVMPQYIQVPTIVPPNNNLPLMPHQNVSYLPNQSHTYAHTMYNPLYNPYIPQPYPLVQPLYANVSVPNEQNTQVSTSQIANSVAPTSNNQNIGKAKSDAVLKRVSSVATNTNLNRSSGSKSLKKPFKTSFQTKFRTIKQSGSHNKTTASTLAAVATRSYRFTSVNKMNSTAKTSVITRARSLKPIRPRPIQPKPPPKAILPAPTFSPPSGMISPPPLTPMTTSRSGSLSCSKTPPPPPLAKATCISPSPSYEQKTAVKTEITSSLDASEEQESHVAKDRNDIEHNVAEYLLALGGSSVNSVIVESNSAIKITNNIVINGPVVDVSDNAASGFGSDSILSHCLSTSNNEAISDEKETDSSKSNAVETLDSEKNESDGFQNEPKLTDDEEEEEDEKMEDDDDISTKVFHSLEVEEEKKIAFNFEIDNQDIPSEISSENISRNCDGSDIFIQEESIPFGGSGDDRCITKTVEKSVHHIRNRDPVPCSSSLSHKEENLFRPVSKSVRECAKTNENVAGKSTESKSAKPAVYADLQPATNAKVLQDLGINTSINLNNYMEMENIRIFFNNNNTRVTPFEPIIKFTSTVKTDLAQVQNYLKPETEPKRNDSLVDSVIQLVSEGPSQNNDFTGNPYINFNSNSNDSHLDLPDLSPLTLNIQADESMPPRGELSEQESLGADNSNWGVFHSNGNSGKTAEAWKSDENARFGSVAETERDKNAKKSFKCSVCHEVFRSPKERRLHRNSVHEGSPPSASRRPKIFGCSHCSATFNSLKDRKLHVIQNHYFDARSKCESIKEELDPAGEVAAALQCQQGFASVKEEEADLQCETSVGTQTNKGTCELPRKCLRCNLSWADSKKLNEHLREAHGISRYKCGTCSDTFESERDFNSHLRIHPLVCSQCGKNFSRKANLRLHMKRHLVVKPYACTLCPKSFITRQKLDEHLNGHSGNKPLKCSLCDSTFSRHSNLIQHRNAHHRYAKKKVKDFVCRCGEVFHSLRKLEWHKEVHETKPKTCLFCSQKFIHSNSVTRHIRRSHMPDYLPDDKKDNENVQCPVCDKIYLRSSLIVHMRVHNGEKPFVCKICNKRFTTKWNLELHNWTHQSRNNMPYKCTTCKSAFFREVDFVAHINSHRNHKPFTCNICGQKFIRKYNCLRHQGEHKKEKKFLCTAAGCGKSFHRSYYLRDHMRIHTGVRPHTCHICGKASSTKSNHNKHVRIHDTREPVNTEN